MVNSVLSEVGSEKNGFSVKNKIVRVGIVGLGRSGWFNHVLTIEEMPEHFTVVAVADPNAERCKEVSEKFKCRIHADLDSLLADENVDVVVLATPTQLHCEQTLKAFEAGKHVICEKPMASSSEEAEKMIQAARRAGKMLTIFQNNRYMPSFMKVREILASGKLGRIIQIRINIHGFGRRWDWQTLKEFSGGELNNTGSHFVDQGLQLFGAEDPEVFCQLERTLTSGDTEDHVKVILQGEGSPLVEVEISKSCAYPQPMWQVMGTAGGLMGSQGALSWKYVDFSKLPPRPVDKTPTPDRSYNSETYDWQEESWTAPDDQPNTYKCFYADVYKTLQENAPLVITPESIKRQIALLEKCRNLSPNI